ncbi:MAG: hypothetical protein HZB68_00560 [Candidatus Aenigmarchaeota archaeon]|nr:hypothetical protein [Candidatus Aenigmarchaeota archaeon]
MASRSLLNLAKEHCDNRVNAPEIERMFTLGEHEISAQEYKALDEITALYKSTPEKEYRRGDIKIGDWGVIFYSASGKGLEYLPDSIGNLKNIEHLGLVWNYLTSIPDSIGNLTKLKVFNVWDNNLTDQEKERLKKLFRNRVHL